MRIKDSKFPGTKVVTLRKDSVLRVSNSTKATIEKSRIFVFSRKQLRFGYGTHSKWKNVNNIFLHSNQLGVLECF